MSMNSNFDVDVELSAAASRIGDLVYTALKMRDKSVAEVAAQIGIPEDTLSKAMTNRLVPEMTFGYGIAALTLLNTRLDINLTERQWTGQMPVPDSSTGEENHP